MGLAVNAQIGLDRESSTRCRSVGQWPPRSRLRRRLGRTNDQNSRAESDRFGTHSGRYGSRKSATIGGFHCRAHASPARAESQFCVCLDEPSMRYSTYFRAAPNSIVLDGIFNISADILNRWRSMPEKSSADEIRLVSCNHGEC
jgi:hypothetical protein